MTTSHTYEILLLAGVLFPMASFWILVFAGPKIGKPGAGWLGVVMGMFIPLVLASIVLGGWWWWEDDASRAALTENAFRFNWADLGTVPVDVGIKLDSLTVAMFFMVTLVACLIFIFSVGYMSGHSDEVDGKSKYSRFFAYLSLFGFSMLGLVVSSNLLFLFICWELVGLCSYLLIGFYFDRAYASAAAIKAFVTNRFGDFGFLIGLMLVYCQLGTLDLDQAATVFADQYATHTGIFASHYTLFGWSLATIMGIGLFCGAMGKSAQFPLHVWLPDAMAGPTPVSALIHAATMVAAGVYLVARVFRLMTPDALMFIATIGCLTLTLMALIAIVQVDIKKCLAYSTLSQLGYMIFGMGCGAWVAALFHLITHAFFKAMLFLCSGQVIEGCHHEQDMRKMGGLRKKMPATCWTFFVGVLAISGAGIPWAIGGIKLGLGGFFSKDEILAVAYTRAYEWEYDKHQPGHHEESPGQGAEHGAMLQPNATARLVSYQEGQPAPTQAQPIPWDELETMLRPQPSDDAVRRVGEILVGIPAPIYNDPARFHPAEHAPFDPATYDEERALGLLRLLNADQAAYVLEGVPEPIRARLANLLAGEQSGQQHAAASHDQSHGASTQSVFANIPPLPKWMFWFAIITAYITPFYMMRAWWMTFMGKPRDEEVHRHAHETPLMYVPLIVLAIGTFVSSYFLFRPLIADAAPAATTAAMVLATDGHVHTEAMNAAHHWLVRGVGAAFLVGFVIAIGIYWKGLATADAIKRAVRPLHVLLERKYFFDEVYNLVWVQGGILLAKISRLIDTYIVDLFFDLAVAVTERFAFFSGWTLDNQGVDGVVNGVAATSMDIGEIVRAPQTGRIRNYVLFAAAVATVVLICVVLSLGSGAAGVDVAAAPLP